MVRGAAAPRRLLAAPRAAAAPRPVRDAGRRQPVGRGRRPVAPARPAVRGRLGRRVRQQLVADLPSPVVLREVRAAVAAGPPVVARGRGAVLLDLALPAAARSALHPRARAPVQHPPAPGDGHLPGGDRVRNRDGAPVPAVVRRVAHLRRHRHEGFRAAVRRRPRDGLAQPRTHAARDADRGRDPRRARSGRPDHDRRPRLAYDPVLGVRLPGWDRAPVACHGAGGRRLRASGDQGGPRARAEPAALDRRALVRHLPLAPADHRPHDPGARPRPRSDPRHGSGGGDVRRGRALVALRRGARAPRRSRTGVEEGQVGRLAPAGALARDPRRACCGGGCAGPRLGRPGRRQAARRLELGLRADARRGRLDPVGVAGVERRGRPRLHSRA